MNGAARSVREFWKRKPLGKNSFLKIVQDCCYTKGIVCSKNRNWVTTHGLYGTLATLLFEAGNSDSSVVIITGYPNPRSLKSDQHLLGEEEQQQQRDILYLKRVI